MNFSRIFKNSKKGKEMFKNRIKKELELLQEPPPGISAWPKEDRLNQFEAVIQGPTGTPYEGGIFRLKIDLTERLIFYSFYTHRYPVDPPSVHFITPIYHPNIDSGLFNFSF